MTSKVLINCSNLHSSGTVFVAASVISNMALLGKHEYDLAVSPKLASHLDIESLKISFNQVFVVDNTSILRFKHSNKELLKNYNIVLTLFGPYYGKVPKSSFHICGCVNPLLIYSSTLSKFRFSLLSMLKIKLRNLIHKYIFSNASLLIVETEDGQKNLAKVLNNDKEIRVISSCFNDYCLKPEAWEPIEHQSLSNKGMKIGILSSNYIYKNVNILNQICKALPSHLDVSFYTTLPEQDFAELIDKKVKDKVFNLGPLKYLQCPSFISEMDIMLCPSLLESCSSIPYDALRLNKVVLMPKTSFNVTFNFSSSVNFYDDGDISYISQQLQYFIANGVEFAQSVNLDSPQTRASKYLDLIQERLEKI